MNIREWTLPVYTILTQLSVGALFVLWIIRAWAKPKLGLEKIDESIKVPVLILLTTAIFAIAFAHLHLSRPGLSFLALRNIASSWLSRELAANILYIVFIVLLLITFFYYRNRFRTTTVFGWLAIFFGFSTDYCMSQIYLLPSQPAWNNILTPVSFLISTLFLGVVTIPVLLMMDWSFKKSQGQTRLTVHSELIETSIRQLAISAVVLCILMTVTLFSQTTSLFKGSLAEQTSLMLLLNIYRPLFILRLVLLFGGVGWLGFTSIRLHQKKMSEDSLLLHVFIACLLVMVAEILGRFLFYAIHVRIGI